MKKNLVTGLGATAIALATLSASTTARADVITFDGMVQDAPFFGTTYAPYEVAAYIGGPWYQSTYGNPADSIYAGPVGSVSDSSIRIERAFSTTFTFDSFDYSCNNGGGSYLVTGTLGGGTVYSHGGVLVGSFPPAYGFTTAFSIDTGVLMDTLIIEVTPGSTTTSINLDNITLNVVPEPTTMLALGLGVVACLKRRRRARV